MSASEEWTTRQWSRYDRLIANFTQQDDDMSKKALCLAFVKSVLDDSLTERLIADALFTVTNGLTSDCELALGKENTSKVKAQLLFLIWSLPCHDWRREAFDAFGDYCRRDAKRPVIPFRNFLASTLRMLARKIADPLADLLEKWL